MILKSFERLLHACSELLLSEHKLIIADYCTPKLKLLLLKIIIIIIIATQNINQESNRFSRHRHPIIKNAVHPGTIICRQSQQSINKSSPAAIRKHMMTVIALLIPSKFFLGFDPHRN